MPSNRILMSNNALWGIDLGGTKVEGAVIVPGPEIKTLARLRLPTGAEHGYQHIINQIVAVVQQLRQETGIEPSRIGIGTPGVAEPATGLMKNCNTTALNGNPLPADLEKALGVPVVVANDANCFALAEAALGSASGIRNGKATVFGIIMGTGVGGGVVINGHVLEGHHGIAGEWGHNFLDASGTPCYCGRTGCVETIISGPALERWYAQHSGQNKRLKEIVELAHTPGADSLATATIDRLCNMFGKAVGTIVNVLDPDAIVLGGGVGNIEELYSLGRQAASRYVFNHEFTTPLLKPTLGDSAGVFGAAMLVAD